MCFEWEEREEREWKVGRERRERINKAGYTAKPVTCCWARAVMQAFLLEYWKRRKTHWRDRQTNQRTDKVTHRVARTRLKMRRERRGRMKSGIPKVLGANENHLPAEYGVWLDTTGERFKVMDHGKIMSVLFLGVKFGGDSLVVEKDLWRHNVWR